MLLLNKIKNNAAVTGIALFIINFLLPTLDIDIPKWLSIVFISISVSLWLLASIPSRILGYRINEVIKIIGSILVGVMCFSTITGLSVKNIDDVRVNISTLSNEQIKQATFALTREMREFEAGYQTADTQQFLERSRNRTDENKPYDPNQGQEDFEKSVKLSRIETNEYQAKYWPKANALLEELRYRLRMKELFREPIPALHGILAGVSPIAEAANYLDNLARKL